MDKVIITHFYEHCLAAFQVAEHLSKPVYVQTAENAVYYYGPSSLLEMYKLALNNHPARNVGYIVDCGAAPGLAMNALKVGHKMLRFDADEVLNRKISSIATKYGASLISGDYQALDLLYEKNPIQKCLEFLSTN